MREETRLNIPDAFLEAIGEVESGRPGEVMPWPWTVNAEGQGHYYESKEAAIAATQALQARGVRSIDIGCLQVNLAQHPNAFASLEAGFDPATNAAYGASFLRALFAQTGSWPRAAAAYHSQTRPLGEAYLQRVFAAWALGPASSGATDHSNAAAPAPASAPFLALFGRPGALPRLGPVRPPGPSLLRLQSGAFGQEDAAPSAPIAFGRTSLGPPPQPPQAALLGLRGRGLAAYRALPVRLSVRLPRKQS